MGVWSGRAAALGLVVSVTFACGEVPRDGEVAGEISSALTCTGGLVACGTACVSLVSDPLNCGHCGRSCLGTACGGGSCQPHALATGVCATSVAADGSHVYYTVSDQ